MFTADETGAGATEIGVVAYLDRAPAGAYAHKLEAHRTGLSALDLAAKRLYDKPFTDCGGDQQDDLIGKLERGELPDFRTPSACCAGTCRRASSPTRPTAETVGS